MRTGTGDVLAGVVSSFDRLLEVGLLVLASTGPVLDVLRERVSAHAYE